MLNSTFQQWLEQLQCLALEDFQRQLVLLVGDACWVKQQLQVNESTEHKATCLVYSNHDAITSTINNKHFAQQLGSEHQKILFSIAENSKDSEVEAINLDAFAALSGTLVAGGVMFLWLEQPLEQAIKSSVLLSSRYFYQQLRNNKALMVVEQSSDQDEDQGLGLLENECSMPAQAVDAFLYQCKTQEQQTAVEHIIKVYQGHRKRPLVLTADRGRGKSSALAIACAQLLENNNTLGHEKINIVITAPHIRSVAIFYRQLSASLAESSAKIDSENGNKTIIKHQNGSVRFVAVDELIQKNKVLKISLLLVDEAAAIPVHLLTQLATVYARVVFSSTVHGYEGAGRGFTLKFQQKLKQLMPQWRNFHINAPIRWRSSDPLERFVFESCLLNAKLNDLPSLTKLSKEMLVKEPLYFSKVPANSLITDPKLLQQIFAVLVTAHYQTSPNDIALLLDNEKAHLFIAKINEDIIGVALLLEEGSESESDIKAIAGNHRRLKNQFLPQSLLTHCGFKESFDYQYLRILRIAIHPQYHRCGFGQRFMTYLRDFAKQRRIDFIGSSFGANAQLLKFWQNCGYQIARIGFTKDHASGEHSALVLSSTSERSQFFERKIINEFYNTFDYLLTDEYQTLTAELVWQILHDCPEKTLPQLSTHQLNSIKDFTLQTRQFSHCVQALHYWCIRHCKTNYNPQILILIERILQKKSIEEVCTNYQLTGKKMLNSTLVSYVAKHQ